MITNPRKKQKLVNDIIATLKNNNFIGVNIDFEENHDGVGSTLGRFSKIIV
jgi:spore germination protein YaaH